MKTFFSIPERYSYSGMFTLAIRWIVGWTYFSAFWRRTILVDKLDPNTAAYIGEKFNHFLPNALGIKPIIEYLVTHPDALWYNMVMFTIIEGVVGLFMLLGLFTRLSSIGVIGLALGILLGSGWIGTTCLDEWQIGILGIAAGFATLLSGSSILSLDGIWIQKKPHITKKKWFIWLASGELPLREKSLKKVAVIGSVTILLITLYTNQVFHGGLWGTLHNLSIKPKIEISDVNFKDDVLDFTIYRTEGVDVYGSFLIGISILDKNETVILEHKHDTLAQFPSAQIQNHYITHVKPGKHSLVVPLGAKATIRLSNEALRNLPNGVYTIVLTDISGTTWTSDFIL